MTKRGGHIAVKHGTAAEQAIKDMFELYEIQKRAIAQWTYPPGRVIKQPNKPPVVVYTGGGVPDVSAIFNIDGIATPAWFDVKTTSRFGRVQLAGKAYRQLKVMERAEKMFGSGFFLVLWRHEKTSINAAVDEWRVHRAGAGSLIKVDDWKETITLSRVDGVLLHPVQGEHRPSDTPWDTQIYIPNLYDYIKLVKGF